MKKETMKNLVECIPGLIFWLIIIYLSGCETRSVLNEKNIRMLHEKEIVSIEISWPEITDEVTTITDKRVFDRIAELSTTFSSENKVMQMIFDGKIVFKFKDTSRAEADFDYRAEKNAIFIAGYMMEDEKFWELMKAYLPEQKRGTVPELPQANQ